MCCCENRESSFSEEEKKNFYDSIPPLMHHFPHMHVMQQRMMQQQTMMQQQQMMQSGDRAKEIEALKQSGILNLVSSPEGRQKLTGLVERIMSARNSSEEKLKTWSEEEKHTFFGDFRQQELVSMVQATLQDSDPLSKISVFLEMPDSALERAVQFQMLVSENDAFLKQVREPEQDEDVAKSLNIVYTTLSSLSSANMRMMGQSGGGHVHGPGCQMHDGGRPGQPDVSVGKSDQMAR